MQAHGEVGINIPDAHDSDDEEIEDKKRESVIKDTVEGLFVVNKMLLTDTRESRLLLRRGRDTPEEVCYKLFPGVCKREVKPEVTAACAAAPTDDSHADQTNEEEEDYIEFAGVRKRGSAAISMPDKGTGGIPLDPRSLTTGAQLSSSPSPTSTAPSPPVDPAAPPDAQSSSSRNSRGVTTDSIFNSTVSSGKRQEQNAPETSSRAVRELYDEDGNAISLGPSPPTADDTQAGRLNEDPKKRKRSEEGAVTDRAADSNSSSSSKSSSASSNAELPPVSVPVEFSDSAFLMKEILAHHLHLFHGTLIDFIPTRSNGKKRYGRPPLLPVSKVVHCGECGSIGESRLCCFAQSPLEVLFCVVLCCFVLCPPGVKRSEIVISRFILSCITT